MTPEGIVDCKPPISQSQNKPPRYDAFVCAAVGHRMPKDPRPDMAQQKGRVMRLKVKRQFHQTRFPVSPHVMMRSRHQLGKSLTLKSCGLGK